MSQPKFIIADSFEEMYKKSPAIKTMKKSKVFTDLEMQEIIKMIREQEKQKDVKMTRQLRVLSTEKEKERLVRMKRQRSIKIRKSPSRPRRTYPRTSPRSSPKK